MLGLLLSSTPMAQESASLLRTDGSELVYQLDVPQGAETYPLVVVAQGSGCLPARDSQAVQRAIDAFADAATLTVEKPGIAAGGDGQCSAEYHRKALMNQRAGDYAQVIASLDGASWWNGDLVLFGGSEGGLVMAALAAQVEADAAILVSTAPGAPFGDIVLAGVPPEGHETVLAGFDKARANPDSEEIWAGQSMRFWADAGDYLALEDMLASRAHFLVIHGGRDAVPAALSRAAADRYAEEERCELTYWELPAYDHAMADPDDRSRMGDVARAAALWARQTLAAPAC